MTPTGSLGSSVLQCGTSLSNQACACAWVIRLCFMTYACNSLESDGSMIKPVECKVGQRRGYRTLRCQRLVLTEALVLDVPVLLNKNILK